jgi:hypothetical protein
VPCQVPDAIVPTEVSEEFTTEEPRVVALKTLTLLILNSFPDAMFTCSLKSQESFALLQEIV